MVKSKFQSLDGVYNTLAIHFHLTATLELQVEESHVNWEFVKLHINNLIHIH